LGIGFLLEPRKRILDVHNCKRRFAGAKQIPAGLPSPATATRQRVSVHQADSSKPHPGEARLGTEGKTSQGSPLKADAAEGSDSENDDKLRISDNASEAPTVSAGDEDDIEGEQKEGR
jgi:hypothetical protein